MTGYAMNALTEWLNRYPHYDGQEQAAVDAAYYKGLPMVLFHFTNEDVPDDCRHLLVTPWCVQYAGNGHYFNTREEAETWIEKRTRRKYMREYFKKHITPEKKKEYYQNTLRNRYFAEFLREHAGRDAEE